MILKQVRKVTEDWNKRKIKKSKYKMKRMNNLKIILRNKDKNWEHFLFQQH